GVSGWLPSLRSARDASPRTQSETGYGRRVVRRRSRVCGSTTGSRGLRGRLRSASARTLRLAARLSRPSQAAPGGARLHLRGAAHGAHGDDPGSSWSHVPVRGAQGGGAVGPRAPRLDELAPEGPARATTL